MILELLQCAREGVFTMCNEQTLILLVETLKEELDNYTCLIYDEKTTCLKNYSWLIGDLSSHSTIKLGNTVLSQHGCCLGYIKFKQDEVEDVEDTFGFTVEINLSSAKNAEVFKYEYLDIFKSIISKYGLEVEVTDYSPLFGCKVTTNIHIPTIETKICKQQVNLVVKVLEELFTEINNFAISQKEGHEQKVLSISNNFKTRAEEFIKTKETEDVEQVKSIVELLNKIKETNLTSLQISKIKEILGE